MKILWVVLGAVILFGFLPRGVRMMGSRGRWPDVRGVPEAARASSGELPSVAEPPAALPGREIAIAPSAPEARGAALAFHQLLVLPTHEIERLLGHPLDGSLLDEKRSLLEPEAVDRVFAHPLYNPLGLAPEPGRRLVVERFLAELDARLAPHDERLMAANVRHARARLLECGIEEPMTPSTLTAEEQRAGRIAFEEDARPRSFLESIAYVVSRRGGAVIRMVPGSDAERDRVLGAMTRALSDAELELIQLMALL